MTQSHRHSHAELKGRATAIYNCNMDDDGLSALAREYAAGEFLEVMPSRPREIPAERRTIAPVERLDDFRACGFVSQDDVVAQFVGGTSVEEAVRDFFGRRTNEPRV